MTTQEIDRIKNAIRHIQTSVEIDPWAVEIAVEAMKAQLSREDTTSDLISRQSAIDVLGVFTQADALGHTPKQIVEALPSVQPETAKRIVGKSRNGMTLWNQCDMCNEPVDAQDNFCRGCGRRLTDG